MKKFFDVVKIALNSDIEHYFENVEILSVKRDKNLNTLNFYLSANDIIPYTALVDARKSIAKEFLNIDVDNDFGDMEKLPIKFFVKYNINDSYTREMIFNDIYIDLAKELKDKSNIYSAIYKRTDFKFVDDTLNIIFFEAPLYNDYYDEIAKFIEDVFADRFDRPINIKIAYKNDDIDDEKDTDSENIKVENSIYENKEGAIENNETEIVKDDIKTDDNKTENTDVENKTNKKRGFGFTLDGDLIYGKKVKGHLREINLAEIHNVMDGIKFTGVVFNYDMHDTKNGWTIFGIKVNDGFSSITVKIFAEPTDKSLFKARIKIGDKIEVIGRIEDDRFAGGYSVRPSCITKVGHRDVIEYGKASEDEYYNTLITEREDNEKEKRVELHLHTKASTKDGIGDVKAYINTAIKFGMKAMAITDHGSVNALADAYEHLDKLKKGNKNLDFKIINGVEGYLVNDIDDFYFDANNKKLSDAYSINDTYVIYDIVSTGLNKKKDSVLKIVAKKIKDFNEIESFESFVKCEKQVPYEIRDTYSININDVQNAKPLNEVLKDFNDFLSGAALVTFNKNNTWRLNELIKENLNVNTKNIDLTILARLMIKELKSVDIISIAKSLDIKLLGVTNRKRNEMKKIISTNDKMILGVNIFIKLLNKLNDEYGVSDISKIDDIFKIDNNFIKRQKYYHIIILAKNDVGRVNLYKLVSDSHIDFIYKDKPRIPRSLLTKYREGLIIGSACIAGEFMSAVKNGASDDELKEMAEFYDYLEIQPVLNNSFLLKEDSENFKTIDDLIELNKKVIEIGEKVNKLVVATCDCHYIEKEDKIYREMLMFGSTFKKANIDSATNEIKSEAIEEQESTNKEELYFRTTDEMLKEFEYLGVDKAYEVVVTNTNKINDMVENILPVRLDKCPPVIEGAETEIKNTCYENLKKIYGDNVIPEIKERLDNELSYIIDNGYSVMYITAKKLIDYSKENGYPVGSRGSVGSSFVATLIGVSEVNPLPPHYVCENCHHIEYETDETKKYDNDTGFDMPDKKCPECGQMMNKNGVNIPFETFLGIPGDPKASKEPDIDLNFASVYQSKIHEKTVDIFGKENTFKAGTVSTVAIKTAYGYVKKFEEKSKLSFSKDQVDFCKYKIVDCKNTSGQHPGGMIVVPRGEYIYTFTPINLAANKEDGGITTHYDYHKIDKNLLKLDILGHDSPLILKKLQEVTGVPFESVPFYEEEVMKLFAGTESLGIKPSDISGTKLGCLSIPEFGTDFAMGMCEEAKPKTYADLIRIAGLSHGTDVWQGNVETLIKNGDCTLKTAICCRDDIMLYLIEKGLDNGLAFNIMESVRKGKGLKEDWEKEMRTHEVPEWYITCCKKIQYMFPKAHAAAYVIASLRIAYYKVHYPKEYYAVYFSVRKDGFDYKLMMQSKEDIHFQIEKINKIINEKKSKNKDYANAIANVEKSENSYEYMAKILEKANKDNDDADKNVDIENDDTKNLTEKYEKMSAKNLHDLYMCYRIVEEMKARNIDFCPIDIHKAHISDFLPMENTNYIMPSFNSIPGIGDRCVFDGDKEPYTSIENFKKRTGVNQKNIDEMIKMGIFNGIKKSDETTLFDLM